MVAPEVKKAKDVLRQVEFYFSDSNLPRDGFLKKTVEESEDGLVSLALICSFSRMRSHLGLGAVKPDEITEETLQTVAAILGESPSLKLSDDGKRVGRSSELLMPAVVVEQVDSRTVAVSPLPYDVTMEDLSSWFNKLGEVNSVRLPRRIEDKKLFCGTALIEFSEAEIAEKALNESLEFAGTKLEIKRKKDFDAEREKKIGEFDETCSNKNASNESHPKGLIISFKLKKSLEEESAKENGNNAIKKEEVLNSPESAIKEEVDISENAVKKEVVIDSSENAIEEETSEKENEDEKEEKADKNHLNTEENAADNASQKSMNKVGKHSTGESDENIVTREDLKQVFEKFGTVKFVDFSMGDESGYIRFEDAEAAVKARAMAVLEDKGGLLVKNFIATVEALTGDAEKEYWTALRGNKDRYYRGRGGRSHRGGRHFGKRSRNMDSFDGRSKTRRVGGDA